MKREYAEYTVTCFTPGCHWQEDHETHEDAVEAGEQHQQAHTSHTTYVFPPAQSRRAA